MYAIKEVFTNFKKSGFMSLISIGTIIITIVILGNYYLANESIKYFLSKIENKIEIVVFLKDDVVLEKINNLVMELKTVSDVEDAKFVSKEDAYQEFIKDKEIFSIMQNFESNPLPNSIKIKLKSYTKKNIDNLINLLKTKEGIEDIQYGGKEIENLVNILNVIKIIAIAVGIIFIISSLFVVSNIINLTIYARRNDIYILKMVGATNTFIRIPFILEGLIHGFLGGLTGWFILYVIVKILLTEIKKQTGLDFSTFYLFNPEFFSFKFLFASISAGILLGFFGSLLSLGKLKEK